MICTRARPHERLFLIPSTPPPSRASEASQASSKSQHYIRISRAGMDSALLCLCRSALRSRSSHPVPSHFSVSGTCLFFQHVEAIGISKSDSAVADGADVAAATQFAFASVCLPSTATNQTQALQPACQQFFRSEFTLQGNLIPLTDVFNDFGVFIYYSMATMTGVGYGDIYPIGVWSRLLVTVQMFVSWVYSAIVISKGISLFQQQSATRKSSGGRRWYHRAFHHIQRFVFQDRPVSSFHVRESRDSLQAQQPSHPNSGDRVVLVSLNDASGHQP